MNINILLLGILVLFTSCNGKASKNKRETEPFVKGDTVSALSPNIMVIYQDQTNVYWFGSWDSGVYRYDGETLINYTTEHGLSSQRIDEVKEDASGHLYFNSVSPKATLTKFDGHSFTEIIPTESDEWKLQANDLWFRDAFQSEKVYRYDGKILHALQLPKPPNLSNPFEIYSIYKDQKGYLWFGTNPVGVCRYDGNTFEWITEEDVTEFRDEGANGVRSIVEDQHGDFWFNTEYRYGVYDSTTLQKKTFYTRKESIGGLDGIVDSDLDEYLSVVRDDQNHLWFVTYRDGVWKYDGENITHYAVKNPLEDITLFSIYKDNHGGLWLGTHENGAYRFNGQAFEKFKP